MPSELHASDLSIARHGACLHPTTALPAVERLRPLFETAFIGRPGVRLRTDHGLADLLAADGPIGSVAAASLGAGCRPVRALAFDKTAGMNWALGWHQDRTICVAERHEVQGFGPWTIKSGLTHVAPPFALLAEMVTLRIHLDDVSARNAPLLIAPGSHLQRVLEPEIASVVDGCGSLACLAGAGDVWAYSTPILHASDRAVGPGRRRVLQVDFAASDLPGGLAWLGL